jgi:allophanate hydrolase subunit 1
MDQTRLQELKFATTRKTEVLQVRLDKQLFDQLSQFVATAKTLGVDVTKSELTRLALQEYLAKFQENEERAN